MYSGWIHKCIQLKCIKMQFLTPCLPGCIKSHHICTQVHYDHIIICILNRWSRWACLSFTKEGNIIGFLELSRQLLYLMTDISHWNSKLPTVFLPSASMLWGLQHVSLRSSLLSSLIKKKTFPVFFLPLVLFASVSSRFPLLTVFS